MALALASARMRVSQSRSLIDRPGHAGVLRRGIDLEVYVARDAYGLQRADIARVLPRGFILALRSHARESENARLRESSFAEQRYLARCVALQDRSIKRLCSYSFLTQGKIACGNILRARICTAVRTGAKRGIPFVSILCT